MSETFTYKVPDPISLNRVDAIADLVRRTFGGVIERSGQEPVFVYLGFAKGQWSRLQALRSLRITDLCLEGRLKAAEASVVPLGSVLQSAAGDIGELGMLVAEVGFELKGTKQSRGYGERVQVRVEKGENAFGYIVNGLPLMTDTPARKGHFERLAGRLDLPLEFIDEDGRFRIVHSGGREVQTWGGLLEHDPEGFWCPLELSCAQLMDKLGIAVREFSSGRIFEVCWRVAFGRRSDADADYPATFDQIAELAISKAFPYEKLSVDLSFQMADLRDLDALQTLCGDKSKIYTRVISFDFDDIDYGEFELETTATGHRLLLTTKLEHDLDDLSKAFGVTLCQD